MTLSQIVGRMQELKHRGGEDPDVIHPQAGDLLMETIRELARHAPKAEQADADIILIAYEQVAKWYA